MKRKFLLIFLSVLMIASLLLTACGDESDESQTTEPEGPVTHTVTFNSMGGTPCPPPLTVVDGAPIHEPPTPTRENSVFLGWYNGNIKWSFTKVVREDVTLVAKWEESEDVLEGEIKNDQVTILGKANVDVTKIPTLNIPSTWNGFPVVAIGDQAFENGFAGSVLKITVPSTVKSIGAHAFANCADIAIDLSKAVLTEVGTYAFANCNLLSTVFLGEGMTTLSAHAFMNCTSLSFIDLPSTLTVIDESAFEGCTNLSSIMIPGSVEKIGHGAFRDCDQLKTVFFGGDRAALDRLLDATEGNNEPFLAIEDEILLYSQTEPVGLGRYWYYDETNTPKEWKTNN